ncbi:hypothetical protein QR680_001368 [Steinernema hermaphroditum]|uniref:Uncharacterized protein n=1 Tax=Steinernema hermaphroditum TaxID=289476 RepID=A0AA39H0S9_9BILA|nr:hypothetical protein QR680_001368 [Steinernema hermaphroditum]
MPRKNLLPELTEHDMESSSVFFSPSSSSSAEASPKMFHQSERPNSARTYRRRRKFTQETMWPSEDEATTEFKWELNGRHAEIGGSKSYLNKSHARNQLRSFNVDKQGKITDCGFTDVSRENSDYEKDQEQRRATCPEIWLNSEDTGPEITKYILRLYGYGTVGKKTLAERLASQAYEDSEDLFTSYDSLASPSRTISFVINNSEVELEIIQGSALESNPFQNVMTIYMVIYSIDSRESFTRAAQTLYRINDSKSKGEAPPIILVANKIDLQRKRRVSFLEGKMLSKIYKCTFIETSALLTANVDMLWSETLRKMQRKEIEKRMRFVGRIVDGGRKFAKSCEELVARIAAI